MCMLWPALKTDRRILEKAQVNWSHRDRDPVLPALPNGRALFGMVEGARDFASFWRVVPLAG